MNLPIEFHAGARRDFDQSFDWYSERSTAAAIGFVAAFDDAVQSISEDPSRFSETSSDCRYCTLKKYPFRIVFLETVEKIIVIAVAHARRRTDYWRNRLSD